MSLYFIPIGIIGTGSISGYLAWLKNKELIKDMQDEKIFVYPTDIKNISNLNHNPIIKIPYNLIPQKYAYGEVQLNKIIQKCIKNTVYKREYSFLLNDYITVECDWIDEEEKIAKQILFPNIFNNIELNKKLYSEKKIKVLLQNNLSTKSHNCSLILDKYESLIQKNIPMYKTSILITDDIYMMEKEENILEPNMDLYLLTNIDTNSFTKSKFYISAFSDNKDKILQEKYSDKINAIENLCLLSGTTIFIGMFSILFVLDVIEKK